MAEKAGLLSEEHPSSDDDGFHTQEPSEKGAFGRPLPFTTPRTRKQGGKISLCALALALLILVPGLVGGAYYLGGKNSYRPLPEPKNLGSCGATPAEARKKGCVFDFIIGTWYRPECMDQEMYDRYLEEWKTLNVTLFSGPNETVPVGLEYGLEGDWEFIWGVGTYHYLHCSYVMEKNWKVLTHELKRVPSNCVEDEHMWHCLGLNGKPDPEDIKSPMKVIKIQPGGRAAVVDAKIPRLPPDCVMVKTAAVSLNPVDWKHISFVPGTDGCTAGSDFAGVVRKVGSKVTTLKAGDRVAGWVHGGNIGSREDGSFADYVVAQQGIVLEIPAGVSFAEAATLGVGISTVGLGLFRRLGLSLPTQPVTSGGLPLLVYGGSTATGALAIQFAKLSGLEVITTCSPRNFAMVRDLGAAAVFDYKSPSVGHDIRELTRNGLYHAFDCISTAESAQICADALSDDTASKKPLYSALLYCDFPRENVCVNVTVAQTIFGKSFTIPELGPEDFPADADDYEFGKTFWEMAERLLAEGKFKVHPLDVRGGGLEGVLEGLEDLKLGKVSGKKLVYNLALSGQNGAAKGVR